MYSVEIDEQRNLLRLTLRGFWTAETLRAFTAELMPIIAARIVAKGNVDALIDCREFAVQSPEQAAGFQKLFIQPGDIVRRAVIMPSALGRMQAERALGPNMLRYFSTEQEAIAWLGKPATTEG